MPSLAPAPGHAVRRSCSPATRLGPALRDQLLEFAHELVDVTERAVHGGEAHIGDRVERVQLPHDRLADDAARDLPLAALLDLPLDPVRHGFDRIRGDRPLLARAEQAVHDLLAVEGLATPVLLDHQRQRGVRALVGGEATPAPVAVPAPPDGVAPLPAPGGADATRR